MFFSVPDITGQILSVSGTAILYGYPFNTTITLVKHNSNPIVTAGLMILQKDTLVVSGSTFSCCTDAPIAVDDSFIVTENDPGTVLFVTTNDFDADNNLDTTTAHIGCAVCDSTTNGSLVNNGDGTFTYTPNPGYTGTDSFIYEVCDSTSQCDTALVTITINPANSPPVAVDDSDTTPEDTPVTTDVTNNDYDLDGNIDPTTVVLPDGVNGLTEPVNGSVSVDPVTGEITYIPDPDFNGVDTYDLTVANVGADDYDFDLSKVLIYADKDKDGLPDSTTPITSTDALAADESFYFVIGAEIPATATNNQQGKLTVKGTSTFVETPTDLVVEKTNTDTVVVSDDAVINVVKSMSANSGAYSISPFVPDDARGGRTPHGRPEATR